MPSKSEEFVMVRIPKDDWQRVNRIADEIGDVSGAWFVQRAVREILEMIDAPSRYVPRIVKIVDGVRLSDVNLEDLVSRKKESGQD